MKSDMKWSRRTGFLRPRSEWPKHNASQQAGSDAATRMLRSIKCLTRHSIVLAVALASAIAVPAAAQTQEWRIVSVNGIDTLGEAVIRFAADGTMTGSSGCNRFNGSVRHTNGSIVIDGPIASTRMACPGADLAAQEDAIFRLLNGDVTSTFNPVAHSLTLSSGGNSMTLATGSAPDAREETVVDQRAELFSANYITVAGVKGPLNIRSEATTSSNVVSRALPGTLLKSDGCEKGIGRDWCQIRYIDSSGTTGWAAAEFLQPAPALVRAKEGVFGRIGTLSCTLENDAQTTDCDFGLAKDAGHSAVLVVFRPDGSSRQLNFLDGQFSGTEVAGKADATNAAVEVENGLVRVSLPGETYSFNMSLISGME